MRTIARANENPNRMRLTDSKEERTKRKLDQTSTKSRIITDRGMSCVRDEDWLKAYPKKKLEDTPAKSRGHEMIRGVRTAVVYVPRPGAPLRYHFDIDDQAATSLIETVDLGEVRSVDGSEHEEKVKQRKVTATLGMNKRQAEIEVMTAEDLSDSVLALCGVDVADPGNGTVRKDGDGDDSDYSGDGAGSAIPAITEAMSLFTGAAPAGPKAKSKAVVKTTNTSSGSSIAQRPAAPSPSANTGLSASPPAARVKKGVESEAVRCGRKRKVADMTQLASKAVADSTGDYRSLLNLFKGAGDMAGLEQGDDESLKAFYNTLNSRVRDLESNIKKAQKLSKNIKDLDATGCEEPKQMQDDTSEIEQMCKKMMDVIKQSMQQGPDL